MCLFLEKFWLLNQTIELMAKILKAVDAYTKARGDFGEDFRLVEFVDEN
jgi:hypothetical protein